MAGKRQHFFDDQVLFHLRACAAAGLSMEKVAAELGMSLRTMQDAIHEDGYTYEVQQCYPMFGRMRDEPRGMTGFRRISLIALRQCPPEVDANCPVIKWLVRPWDGSKSYSEERAA